MGAVRATARVLVVPCKLHPHGALVLWGECAEVE